MSFRYIILLTTKNYTKILSLANVLLQLKQSAFL